MNLEKLREQLEIDEGVKYETYNDHLGFATFGVGHLVLESDPEFGQEIGTPVAADRVAEAFESDCESVLRDCNILYEDFDDLPEEAQQVISNMMFNMGRPRLTKFRGMKRGVDSRDWNAAADEMVDSAWYRQVTNRADRLVTRMRNIATVWGSSTVNMEQSIAMVICTDKKYVFVKVYKTGGTSIYRELKKHSKSQYLLGTMYGNGTGVLQDYKTAVNAAEQGHDSGVKRKHDHVKSSWIKENAFPELGLDWDKYFKFGFVRNPWDRELSNYFFNSGKLKPPEDISFKEWLNIRLQKNGFIRSHNSSQCDYLTDVNYVARFENYDEEVKYLFNRIGVPMPQPLMHINKTDHKPYYEYYDDIDIMKVQQWYEKDIEMYNYEFGE